MVKLNIRQYLLGFIITIAAIGVATYCFKPPFPNVAKVVSSEPIRASITVHQSYCHIAVFPIPATVKDLPGNSLVAREYQILTLLDYLKVKKEYPALSHSALEHCIPVHFEQVSIIGYDINYEIGEKGGGKVRMPYEPGSSIPLNEKGQLIINAPLE
ncbi:UmoD [Xenorhabdus mauleonii]|uniref:UmoD n=1 Tax=Xenorhabdus mauleonii TaxID=351675 RepID=A0A1I3UAY2_9GAMM|nr:UmoD family flagellar biogenesis regulator [Xenorhabdus mauleonii]PHM45937.1 UmoD [Xenorhabdus mauleonii]SFJ78947.1 Uncharacterized conserved protein YcfJ, contains glycine zipper 2TM domain [Xenorhabdus mauleonii]